MYSLVTHHYICYTLQGKNSRPQPKRRERWRLLLAPKNSSNVKALEKMATSTEDLHHPCRDVLHCKYVQSLSKLKCTYLLLLSDCKKMISEHFTQNYLEKILPNYLEWSQIENHNLKKLFRCFFL